MPKPIANSRKPSRLSLITEKSSDASSDIADWGGIDGKVVVDLVQVITRLGGAVRFGYTRDGGAYSVGIYLDDDRSTFYFSPDVDVEAALEKLTEKLRIIGQ